MLVEQLFSLLSYLMVFVEPLQHSHQERLAAWLASVKLSFDKKGSRISGGWSAENVIKIFNMGTDLTKPFEYLLATGNLNSKTGQTV